MFNSHLKAKNEKEKQLASLKLSLQHFQKIVEDAQNQRKVVKQTEEIQQRVELLKLQFKRKHEIIASIKKVTEIFKNTELHVKTAEKNKRKVKTQALKKSPTKLNPSKTIKIDDNSLTQQKLKPLNELSEQEEFSENSSSIKEKGSTVRLGSEIDTSSANTETKKSQMDIDPSKLLKKNTLRKRNDNFGTNPYYPDYFGKREKEIEDIRDESGIELEYISDQRKYKPADIARDLLINANKSTKLTQINSFTFKTDNYEDKFQDKIAQKEYKEHREMSDKLSLLKTIAGIESKRPEIITKNKRIAHSITSPKKGCTRNFNAKFWTFMSSLPSVDKNIRNETLIEQTPGFSKKPTMISKT